MEQYVHGGDIVKFGGENGHGGVMVVYVGGDLLEELEGIFYEVYEQIGIVVAAVDEVIIQLIEAQMLPIDKLLAPLLDEQFKVAETNSLIKVSN